MDWLVFGFKENIYQNHNIPCCGSRNTSRCRSGLPSSSHHPNPRQHEVHHHLVSARLHHPSSYEGTVKSVLIWLFHASSLAISLYTAPLSSVIHNRIITCGISSANTKRILGRALAALPCAFWNPSSVFSVFTAGPNSTAQS